MVLAFATLSVVLAFGSVLQKCLRFCCSAKGALKELGLMVIASAFVGSGPRFACRELLIVARL